jgi:hypothetical protein
MAVPVQGMTVIVQTRQPCPMEMMSNAADGADMHDMKAEVIKRDCCLDDEAAARSGQLCKPGQKCHAGQFSVMCSAPAITFHAVNPRPSYLPDPVYSPLALTAIWRPPLALLH